MKNCHPEAKVLIVRNASDRTQMRRTSRSPNRHESYNEKNRGRSDIPKSEQLRSVQYPSIFSKNTSQRKQSLQSPSNI